MCSTVRSLKKDWVEGSKKGHSLTSRKSMNKYLQSTLILGSEPKLSFDDPAVNGFMGWSPRGGYSNYGLTGGPVSLKECKS